MGLRKPYFAFRYKLLLGLVVIIVVSHGAFLFVGRRTFSDDKRIFLRELGVSLLEGAQSAIVLELKSRIEKVQVLLPQLVPGGQPRPAGGATPVETADLLGVSFYRSGADGPELIRAVKNAALLKRLSLPEDLLSTVRERHPIPQEAAARPPEIRILNRSVSRPTGSAIGVLTAVLPAKPVENGGADLIVVDFLQDFLSQALRRSEQAELFLVTKSGSLLSHARISETTRYAEAPFTHPIVKQLEAEVPLKALVDLTVDGEPYALLVADTGFEGVYLVAQIRKNQALHVLRTFSNRTLILTLVSFWLAVVIGVFLSRELSRSLAKLQDVANRIGAGESSAGVDLPANDEVGRVSESFNWMAARLSEVVRDSLDKGRTAAAREAAAVASTTILCPPRLASDLLEVRSYVDPKCERPASFWDAAVAGQKVTLMMGSASGPGPGATIVTAVAKSCFLTIQRALRENAVEPAVLMRLLNTIVHQACRGELQMTACFAQLDLATGELVVCNAGHPSPIHLKWLPMEKRVERLPSNGSPIGADPAAKFEAERYQLSQGDTIVLHTPALLTARASQKGDTSSDWVQRELADLGQGGLGAIEQKLVAGLRADPEAPVVEDVLFTFVRWKGRREAKPPKAA